MSDLEIKPEMEMDEYFMVAYDKDSPEPIFTITKDLELVLGEGVTPRDVADALVAAWSESMGAWLERRRAVEATGPTAQARMKMED